jgi:hypothetical protein
MYAITSRNHQARVFARRWSWRIMRPVCIARPHPAWPKPARVEPEAKEQ